jgi:imidazolonepropionase-like amidohydrolase
MGGTCFHKQCFKQRRTYALKVSSAGTNGKSRDSNCCRPQSGLTHFHLPRPTRMLHKLAALVIALLITGPALAQNASPTLAITNVNVIPMDTERILEHQTVLIRNGKIAAIRSSLAIPPGATKINGNGKFLMPGLIDAHVHLMSADDLISYLAYGVTTVVNMSGTPADLELRRKVRSGVLVGPSIYTAGPTIDGYPPLNEVFVTAETPEQGAALVADHKREGYDFIKVYGTLRPDVFRAIAAACKREHIALTGHINRQIPSNDVFEAGQVLAAHAEDLIFARYDHPPTKEELTTLADDVRLSGITVTANVAINPATGDQVRNLDEVLSRDEAQYLSAATFSRWIRANNRNVDEDPKQHLANLLEAQAMDLLFIRLLHERNVPIVLGTDASAYGFPGESAWEELKQTQAAGHTRFEALATATRNSGKYLNTHIDHTQSVGTVTVGATADLLLLDSNPLTTDFKRSNLAGIVLRGRWRPIAQIDLQRERLKRRLGAEHTAVNAADQILEKGDVTSARRLMKSASRLSPLLDEWVLLTKVRKQEVRSAAAIEMARFYVQQFPDRFSSHQLLADLLLRSGNSRAAKAEARTALRLQPHGSTATNTLSKATFTQSLPSFLPGDYELRLQSESQPATALLRLRRDQDKWAGTVKIGDDSAPIREIYAGANQVWFKTGQDFQEKEIRLSISSSGQLNGSWWAMFGRNGTVTGKVVP